MSKNQDNYLSVAGPLTQADLEKMDFDKVWISYGPEPDNGEWALVYGGQLYSIDTLEGAGFEDMLRDLVEGESLDNPSGAYRVYRSSLKEFRNTLPDNPLTLEQLRGMGGQPVWIVEQPDWGHWELSEDAEDYLCDRDTGLYGLTYPDPDGKGGLNQLGWIAYTYPPAHIGRGIWMNASERMPEGGQIVLVTVSGKPQSNITLEYAYELAEWSIEEGWILNCWPEWKGAKVTHWMPLPEPPTELEKRLRW